MTDVTNTEWVAPPRELMMLQGTSLTRAMKDVVDKLGIGIKAYQFFPSDWEQLIPEDGSQFLALVYQLDDDRFIATEQTIIQVDVYGAGTDRTLTKATELQQRLVWDQFGSSYHFFEGGMFDDVEVRGRTAAVPDDMDRASLVTTRYTVTTRS